MAIRDQLLANVAVALAGTSCGVSLELPWNSGQQALYEKNMKKFYISEESQEITQLIKTLAHDCDVIQNTATLTAYLTVDAKNQPADITTVVSGVLNSKNSISNQFTTECVATTEIIEDRLTYTFEYLFQSIYNQ